MSRHRSLTRRPRRARRVLALLALLLPACAESDTSSIAPAALAQRIAAGSAPFVLDVRTPEEFRAGHVPGAVNIPHTELAQRVDELGVARDEELVIHCQSGRRAEMASEVLSDAGFQRVIELDGHWAAWSAAELPRE